MIGEAPAVIASASQSQLRQKAQTIRRFCVFGHDADFADMRNRTPQPRNNFFIPDSLCASVKPPSSHQLALANEGNGQAIALFPKKQAFNFA